MPTLNFSQSDRCRSLRSLATHSRQVLALCLLAVLISGCNEPPTVETRTVPKPPKDRTLAAIVPIGRDGWFFKLSGPSKLVAAQEASFRKLLKSIKLRRGAPIWKTPDGWTEEPGEGMRQATFKVETDGPTLECTVIKLPDRGGNPASTEYTLANINRWRSQLNLDPLSRADLAMEIKDDSEIHSLSIAENLINATWVNFEGRQGGKPQGPMSAPFAGGAGGQSPHGGGAPPMASSGGGRMLAAIVPVAKTGWFFKVQGEDKLVAAQEENFLALLKSLRIEGDKPVWRSPKDWHELAGSGMRAATFEIGEGDSRLECSVIPLPADDPTTTDYLLSNINRWRGQVGLDRLSEKEFAGDRNDGAGGEIRTLKIDGDVTVTWVNINGKPSSAKPSSTGAAGPPSRPGAATGPGASRPGAASAGLGVTFTVPKGWQNAAPRTMVLVGWDVKRNGEALQIYISKLGAAGSDLVQNVNRWRRQAGLEQLSGAELKNTIDPMKIGGVDGHVVNLRGASKTITGAIAIHGGTGWFFKLQGDPKLAAEEKMNFESWLKSIRFE